MRITICSSAFFAKQAYETKKKLEEKGHTAFIFPNEISVGSGTIPVERYYELRKSKLTEDLLKTKASLMEDHISKIENSDAILVLNFPKNGKEGYIGGNVFLEMAIAFYLGKKIFLWEKPSTGLSYLEEILPMNPIVLDRDLGKISSLPSRVVLASESGQRKMLMDRLGIDYEIIKSGVDESKISDSNPAELTKKLAQAKAEAAARKAGRNAVVIGADTLVCFNGETIGKPKDESDARRILKLLSGKTHSVVTGLCVISKSNGKIFTESTETEVTFRKLTDKEIDGFIKTKAPLNHAGAYSYEMHFSIFEKINGSDTNVIGLPMEKLIPMLREQGIEV
jgi:septum formation protein